MITSIFSRYLPRYVRGLVYMMQASEYYPFEYLRWYHRTSDFSQVEKRKHLVKTSKSRALLWVGYCIPPVMLVVAILGFISSPGPLYFIVLMASIFYPFVLPYLLLIALGLINFLQKPVEDRMIANAKTILTRHSGVKIAIAGSYGKTTMREILRTILSEGKKVAAPPGSYNTPLGIASFVNSLDGDEEVLIFEMGEYYPGDIRKLCEFVEPQWGIITGANEAHLERFGTLEKTVTTVFELAEWLKKRPIYVNGEDVRVSQHASNHIMYSRDGAGFWKVESASTDLSGTHITFAQEDGTVSVSSRLLGLHMVGSISAAADICSRLGLSEKQIIEGIAKTAPFAHRMQPRNDGGVTIIDDSYNGNPDGVAAAIEFLNGLTSRRWFVTPGLVEMGDKKKEVHQKIGNQLAVASIEKIVLIKDSVTPYIEEGLKSAGFKGEILRYQGMPEALKAVNSMTVPGDVVLIQNDWPDQYA